ncbi:MAG: hypothetical protein ACRD44_04935 [Bryobacteraceae bacterium]
MNSGAAIALRGLRKKYGDFEAAGGIDFEVRSGEVFGLLGVANRVGLFEQE